MSEMVERVARALYDHAQIEEPEEGDFEFERSYWMEHARAAISVMREPTDYMTAAAWSDTAKATVEERMALELTDNRTAFRFKMKRRWAAMIDAALS